MNIGIIECNNQFRKKLIEKITRVKRYNVILNCDSVKVFQKWHHYYMKLDVILLGLDSAQMSCADGIHLVKSERSDVKIVIITRKNDEQCIVKALRAGADGYLLKDPFPDIEKELKLIKDGKNPVSPTVIQKIFNYFNPPNSVFSQQKRGKWTQKETIVIKYIIDGLSHMKIAEQMGITTNGVLYHTKNIYKKLRVNSKSGVFKKYMDGMIEL